MNAGETPERPLYMQVITDDKGQIRKTVILLALGLAATAIQVYLASQGQRKASSADFNKMLQLRIYDTGRRFCSYQSEAWQVLAGKCATEYHKATL